MKTAAWHCGVKNPQWYESTLWQISFLPNNSVESTPCSSGKPPLVCLESQYLQIISHLQGPFIMERKEIGSFEKASSWVLCLGMTTKQRSWDFLWFSPDSAIWLHNSPWVTCILCIYKMGSMTFIEKNVVTFIQEYCSVSGTDRRHGTRMMFCSSLLCFFPSHQTAMFI